MNVLIINGSPKGEHSVTLQTSKYIQKHNPQDNFDFINVPLNSKKIASEIPAIIEKMISSDFILFSYPVYTLTVPSQLLDFIFILKETIKSGSLKGKYVSQITTSKHFFDFTAHNLIKENCLDLGMIYLEGLSADMDDLPKKRGQQEALDFWRYINFQINPAAVQLSTSKESHKIALIYDLTDDDAELKSKIEDFKSQFPYQIAEFNLQNLRMDGGCLGCLKCTTEGKCCYKDGFEDILRQQILDVEGTVYAFSVQNHSMGINFKKFHDRQFCNGHRTLSMDKPVAYIVNGNLSQEQNLLTTIIGTSNVGKNPIAQIVDSQNYDMKTLVTNLSYLLEQPVKQPQNFYGTGGIKIFRDMIYVMSGFMREDYKFFKENGFFKDLPTNQKKTRFGMKLVGLLMKNPKLRVFIGHGLFEGMLMPYKKVLKED